MAAPPVPADPPDLDAVTLDDLRRRTTVKWSRFGPDVLPAWVADMDFPIAEPVAAAIEEWVARRDFAYRSETVDERVKVALAAWQEQRHGLHVDPGLVHLLSGAVQGIHLLTLLASRPGDGVVVLTPSYGPFLAAVASHGRRLLELRLHRTAAGWVWDDDDLERIGTERPSLLLLCNPHNPTGRVFTRAELERLAGWAERHDVTVVSDEIHADLVHDPHVHLPFAALGAEVAARTVTLTAATKAFNLAATHLAFVVLGDGRLSRRFADLSSPAHGYPGELGMVAATAAWSEGVRWLDAVRAYLGANRDHVAAALARRRGVEHVPPEATYLAWLDLRAAGLGDEPAADLLATARIALSPGLDFGEAGRGFARLNFATPRAVLDEIVGRLVARLDVAAAG